MTITDSVEKDTGLL